MKKGNEVRCQVIQFFLFRIFESKDGSIRWDTVATEKIDFFRKFAHSHVTDQADAEEW